MTQNINPEDDLEDQGGARPANSAKDRLLRVLVVDDNDNFRRSMSLMLSFAFDIEVMEADSGLAALDEIRRGGHYDFIFLDMTMPGMSGVETYEELNRLGIQSHIVLMTAYTGGQEWSDARELGLDLLDKPISREKLDEILSTSGTK